MTSSHKAKRLSRGHYVYRGFKVDHIYPLGWEAVDEFGCGFAHAGTLSGVKVLIDWDLDRNVGHETHCICPVCGGILGTYGECDLCDDREKCSDMF